MARFQQVLCLLSASLFVLPAIADEPSAGFTTVRTFPAPEAHQGVAASREHVFAVTNRTVALYDRQTGKRLGLSTGEAMHLNSGFVWKGRVLCAHSNYPLQPEKSEVKVFDPITLELATLVNFADYGGSLTWIVRRRGHWLCNFARYDENNGETFLVEFDAGFNELRRWTYPQSVIGKLGKYSLSGGIWYRGELLVTGHDDPVAFRVRIPRQGTELEHVGSYAIPFTGQGFAVDPVGGYQPCQAPGDLCQPGQKIVESPDGDLSRLPMQVLNYYSIAHFFLWLLVARWAGINWLTFLLLSVGRELLELVLPFEFAVRSLDRHG